MKLHGLIFFLAVTVSSCASVAEVPVRLSGAQAPLNGLNGRTIALWNSHGAYYNEDKDRWIFQRAPLNTTVEDVYTASYVYDLLAPMLENAGAYVMIPRERDTSPIELISDGDNATKTPGFTKSGFWSVAKGYAYPSEIISDGENPLTAGTAFTAKAGSDATASWCISPTESGTFTLYVSYPKMADASTAVKYKVSSLRGDETYIVNQSMGAGTWMRLGEVQVRKGEPLKIELQAQNASAGNVGADAVRLGGGMGNIGRGSDGLVSNLPRWAEGARYWLQYAGFPSTVYSPEESETDYTDDIRCRPLWVNYLSGGSKSNPRQKGLNIPVDVALALHTDAGTTPDSTIVGTLGIYCTDGARLGDGRRRSVSKSLAETVTGQITEDIRALHCPWWEQRKLRDRRYAEARYPVVPSVLIELLSHQNYADMTYGLDPNFRFTAARAIYKGLLRWFYSTTKKEPIVQPLPVRSMAIEHTPSGYYLSWLPTNDPLEPTATPDRYIIQRRIGLDGAFVDIAETDNTSISIPLIADAVNSFRVIAMNEGGKSFPSEILAVGNFSNEYPETLIVNGFTRLSAPESYSTDCEAGFLIGTDPEVAYGRNIGYIGGQYDFDRNSQWTSDDLHPGHGASYLDNAGDVVRGNTFDYPALHGSAMASKGYPFISASLEGYLRLESEGKYSQPVIDLILGRQRQTKSIDYDKTTDYKAFPEELQDALTRHINEGKGLLVSGEKLMTDLCANPYSCEATSASDKAFASNVLGLQLVNEFDYTSDQVTLTPWWANNSIAQHAQLSTLPNSQQYHIVNPDALASTRDGGFTIARYEGDNHSAAVVSPFTEAQGGVVAYGIPLESILSTEQMTDAICAALFYLLPYRLPSAPAIKLPLPPVPLFPTPIPKATPPTNL